MVTEKLIKPRESFLFEIADEMIAMARLNMEYLPCTERGEDIARSFDEVSEMEIKLKPILHGETHRQAELKAILRDSVQVYLNAFVHDDVYAPNDGRYETPKPKPPCGRTKPVARMTPGGRRNNRQVKRKDSPSKAIPHSGKDNDDNDDYTVSVVRRLEDSIFCYRRYLKCAMEHHKLD